MVHGAQVLTGKKIYLSDQTFDNHFQVPLSSGALAFDSGCYEKVITIVTFQSIVSIEAINPVILKNRDEILPLETAFQRLGLDGTKLVAFYGLSGIPEYFEQFKSKYSYLTDEGYKLIYSGTYQAGLFPVIDFFNVIDLLVCGGGYNKVWEENYFGKKTMFEMLDANFSDQSLLIKTSESFHFDNNGADQLTDIIINL